MRNVLPRGSVRFDSAMVLLVLHSEDNAKTKTLCLTIKIRKIEDPEQEDYHVMRMSIYMYVQICLLEYKSRNMNEIPINCINIVLLHMLIILMMIIIMYIHSFHFHFHHHHSFHFLAFPTLFSLSTEKFFFWIFLWVSDSSIHEIWLKHANYRK